MTALEIIYNLVALDRHLDVNRDHPLAGTGIAVDIVHGLPCSVGQVGNPLTHGPFDIVLHFLHALGHLTAAIFAHQTLKLTFGDLRRLRL